MRKRNLFFSAIMVLAMGALSSCSDDLTTDNQVQTIDHDQVRYLNVTISSPTSVGTRAASFQEGTSEENFVKNMTFVFYDAAGLPTGQSYDAPTFKSNETKDGFTDLTGNGNVDKIWTSTVPVQLAQGENLPAYVVCFINSLGIAELKTKSLAELDEVMRQAVIRTDTETEKTGEGEDATTTTTIKNYFPMTNAVYYGTDVITGETNVRVFAAPIITGQLYATEDAAKTGKTVDIYVERYAARVQLTMANTASKANTSDVNGYTLTFVPEYWRPNAIDQNIYAVKRYGLIEADNKANYNPTYTALLGNFGSRTWWNDATNFRSYWGCSPSYYENEYPEVSDDITDVASKNDYTGTGANKYPYSLHYFNYDQIASSTVAGGVIFQPSNQWDATNGFNQVYYARETTTASRAWGYNQTTQKGYNPLASIPSAVIVGYYTLTRTNTNLTEVPEGRPTFYLYGKTNSKHNLYFDSNIQSAMIDNQSVVLQKTEITEGGVTTVTYPTYRGTTGWKVEHPSKAVRDINKVKVAGRLVALQLDANALPNNLYYYDATKPDGQKYVQITTENINIVNSNLLTTGYATKYGDGIAYFNIPIEHLGIRDDAGNYVTDAKKATTGNEYDFTKCPAGSFGIVRNHVYTINVTGISGLGTALRDKNQPIVPPVDEKTYYISAKLNILNWRIVPPQSVEL